METFLWLLPYIIISIEIGILSGTVGAYIYSRRLASIVGGLSHFLLGPIGLAYLLAYIFKIDINTSIFSMVFMIIIGLILPIDKTGKIQVDSEIQVLWSLGMSFGVLVMFLLPGYLNLDSFLFGSLLTISNEHIIFISIISVVVLTIEFLFHNRLKYLGIDDDFLRTLGINPTPFHRLQLIIIVITINILLESIGILLMITVLVIPAGIASMIATKYKVFVILSILCSVFFLILGIILGYVLNLQMSAVTALVLCICYFIVRIFFIIRNKRTVNTSKL